MPFETTLLTVVAEMAAKPGKEEELRLALLALVEPTRQEEGCVQYDLHVHTSEPGRFVFYENWTSAAALDKHSQSAHIQAFRTGAADLLSEPARILTYTRIA
jgi:quinol monooxygenase YgiN